MSDRAVAASPRPPASGRLAILSGLSLAASAIPVPFLPDRVVFQIRGAVVQDIAARHGLSLTTDARRILAEASSESPVRDVLKGALGFLSKTVLRRLGPLAAVMSAAAAVEVFTLGHLFERYLDRHRGSNTVRIHADEARALRKLVDAAAVRAISPALRPDPVPLLPGVEDLRDEFTRWVDTVLLLSASLPGYVERRLDTAFDALVAEEGSPA
ncbi:MAG TPA: hypothetical protein VL400_08490 [Polyangiaceae bacterium]|jgi:hypothetical protein|nr:hypothetical protein [Polyangiaceae bacterium]